MAQYELRIYNTSGTLQAIVTDFLSLTYIKKLNKPGGLWFTLKGSTPLLEDISDKWIIEVRRNGGNGWLTELTTLFRNETWRYGDTGPTFSAYCVGIKSMLWWRVVNFYSGFADRSAFSNVPAETIVKTIVNYNLGANATTGNSRKRTGTIANFTVEADGATGTNAYWNCHGENVGETIFELSESLDFDYDVVATSPNVYEFQFSNGDLGDDLSTTQIFSIINGNMKNPIWNVSRTAEKTVGCMWGKGSGAGRHYLTVLGTNHSSTNDIEKYIRATNIDFGDDNALGDKGDSDLKELEAKSTFKFDVLQGVSNQYSDDYNLGDVVSAINPFNGTELNNMKIIEVSVSIDKGGKEKIGVKIESK